MENIWDNITNLGFDFVIKIVLSIIVFFVGKFLIKIVLKLLAKAMEKVKADMMVIKFTNSIAKIVLYIIIAIGIVEILGLPTTAFVTLFGTVGLTVGLALQGSLSNFAGGVLILLFKPFHVGDYIIVCGNEGTVFGIDVFYTKLRTVDNRVVIIPNGTLANSSLTNVTTEQFRRLDIQIGISYDSDIKKATQILRDIIEKDDRALKDHDINVFVSSLDASQITLETRVWTLGADYWQTKWDMLEKYKLAFDENGIEIPFNQLSVTVKNMAGE